MSQSSTHLVYLVVVVEHGARGLRQVVERRVATQCGRQRRRRRRLRTRCQRGGAARARRQRAFQALREVADCLEDSIFG